MVKKSALSVVSALQNKCITENIFWWQTKDFAESTSCYVATNVPVPIG
jgi:hypothetical protein